MNDMYVLNATDVRRDWSSVMERAVREKPQFIKRTRDHMVLMDIRLLEVLLAAYRYTAVKAIEVDGSVTLYLNELDLVENAETEPEAKLLLGSAILDYAEDFYQDFSVWSSAPNRKSHIPYVLKALIIDDPKKIGESIECPAGET